jgi:hypothetical protein
LFGLELLSETRKLGFFSRAEQKLSRLIQYVVSVFLTETTAARPEALAPIHPVLAVYQTELAAEALHDSLTSLTSGTG